MRITRRQLRRLIKEEISLLSETTALDQIEDKKADKARQDFLKVYQSALAELDEMLRESWAKAYSKGINTLKQGGNQGDLIKLFHPGKKDKMVVWVKTYRPGESIFYAAVGRGSGGERPTWPITYYRLDDNLDSNGNPTWEEMTDAPRGRYSGSISFREMLSMMEESLQDMNSRFDSEEAEATEESTQDQMPESWLQILGKCLEG